MCWPSEVATPRHVAAKLGRGTPVYRFSHIVMNMLQATASHASTTTAAASSRRARLRIDAAAHAWKSSATAAYAIIAMEMTVSSQPGTVECTSGYENIAACHGTWMVAHMEGGASEMHATARLRKLRARGARLVLGR